MKRTNCKWIYRLIDRITAIDQSNNDYFSYYGRCVTLQSCTRDFVAVFVSGYDTDSNTIKFSFDFWTKKLVIECVENDQQREAIIDAFRHVYSWTNIRIIIND